jgi:branched-chain amino acid transport system substrate-binding protein
MAGAHARQGVDLAVADAAVAGKTISGRPVGVLHVDCRGERETLQAEAVRLITINKAVAILGGWEMPLNERLVRTAQGYGLGVVVPGDLPQSTSGEAVRGLAADPSDRGLALARLAEELKRTRALALTDLRGGDAAAAPHFLRPLRRIPSAVVEEWTYTREEELGNVKERLGTLKPDVVLITTSPGDFSRLRDLVLASGVKPVFLYAGPDVGPTPLLRAPEGQPDVYLATVFTPDGLTAQGKDFAKRYEERFHEPADLFAAGAYDAARLLLEAMDRAQSLKPERIGEELTATRAFESVTGPVSWADGRTHRRLFVVRLRKNEETVHRTIEPGGQ